jgi:hypothetical protein
MEECVSKMNAVGKELNPKTCMFVTKCKPGEERNQSGRCVKITQRSSQRKKAVQPNRQQIIEQAKTQWEDPTYTTPEKVRFANKPMIQGIPQHKITRRRAKKPAKLYKNPPLLTGFETIEENMGKDNADPKTNVWKGQDFAAIKNSIELKDTQLLKNPPTMAMDEESGLVFPAPLNAPAARTRYSLRRAKQKKDLNEAVGPSKSVRPTKALGEKALSMFVNKAEQKSTKVPATKTSATKVPVLKNFPENRPLARRNVSSRQIGQIPKSKPDTKKKKKRSPPGKPPPLPSSSKGRNPVPELKPLQLRRQIANSLKLYKGIGSKL